MTGWSLLDLLNLNPSETSLTTFLYNDRQRLFPKSAMHMLAVKDQSLQKLAEAVSHRHCEGSDFLGCFGDHNFQKKCSCWLL